MKINTLANIGTVLLMILPVLLGILIWIPCLLTLQIVLTDILVALTLYLLIRFGSEDSKSNLDELNDILEELKKSNNL